MESGTRDHDSAELPLLVRGAADTATQTQQLPDRDSESRPPRLISLDISRGVTMALMLFVNHAGNSPWWLPHADWDGIHLADFVMPGFLVIVGASIALSVSAQRQRGACTADLVQKAATRTSKLFVMGLFIQGGVRTGHFPEFDLSTIRVMGILQRIAICFFVMSLAAIGTLPAKRLLPRVSQDVLGALDSSPGTDGSGAEGKPHPGRAVRVQVSLWGMAVSVLLVYTALSLTVPVPGCTPPALTPDCNAASWIDAKVLGKAHLYPYPSCRSSHPPCKAFDPEGLFTTAGGAMSSTAIGLGYGSAFLMLRTQKARIQTVGLLAVALMAAGISLHSLWIPLNKNLYSASFVLLTSGVTGSLLAAVYLMSDVRNVPAFNFAAQPFVWLGNNPIAVFFGDEVLEMSFPLIFWKKPEYNLRDWLWKLTVAPVFGAGTSGWLIGAFVDVLFWTLVAWWLYRKRIFFKV